MLNSVDSIAIQKNIFLNNNIHGISSRIASIYSKNNYLKNINSGIGINLQSKNNININNTEILNFSIGIQQSHSNLTGSEIVIKSCNDGLLVRWLSGGNPSAERLELHNSNFLNIVSNLVVIRPSCLINDAQM